MILKKNTKKTKQTPFPQRTCLVPCKPLLILTDIFTKHCEKIPHVVYMVNSKY